MFRISTISTIIILPILYHAGSLVGHVFYRFPMLCDETLYDLVANCQFSFVFTSFVNEIKMHIRDSEFHSSFHGARRFVAPLGFSRIQQNLPVRGECFVLLPHSWRTARWGNEFKNTRHIRYTLRSVETVCFFRALRSVNPEISSSRLI